MKVSVAIAVATAVLLIAPAVNSQAQSSADARKLEQQLAKKKKELRNVAADRRKIDSQRGSAAKQLRAADEQVGRTAAELARTQQQIAVEKQNLSELGLQREVLRSSLGKQISERHKLVRAAYQHNRSGPLKTLLSQDSVAKSQRQMVYHRYLQQDRRARIKGLNQKLTGLDEVQSQINERTGELARNQVRQQRQATQLANDRADRAKVVNQLNAKCATAAAREKDLGRDVAGLNKLLGQLRAAAAKAEAERRAIARKKAAEEAAARREAQRVAKAKAQQEARERQRAAAAAATNTTKAKPPTPARQPVAKTAVATQAPKPTSTPASTPARKPQIVERAKPTQVASAGPSVGGVGWPATGSLLAGFGGTMPDGRRSQGLLIGAARGAPVKAVANGEVVYAQWMTGYGQLLIIDHGGGRMSLYAYNEAILKSVGDRVSRGDTVATVGTSGGQGRPALYFELRSNGAPINPRSMMQ